MRSWIPWLHRTRPADNAPRDNHPAAHQEEPRQVTRAAQYVAELAGTHTAAGRLAYDLRVVRRDPSQVGRDDGLAPAQVLFGPVTVEGDPGLAIHLAQVLLARQGWCLCDFWTPDTAAWVYRAEVHTIDRGEA
jgi:hypothetical protein